MKRNSLSSKASRGLFSKTASRTHRKNILGATTVMRGGIRLCAMPCFFPLEGWKGRETTQRGKRKVVFSAAAGFPELPVTVPCGQCIGCALERSRQWGVRLMHEKQMHDLSIFVTLTYSDENLPEGETLVKAHFQNFMKRLRKFHGSKIRYFHCGEYGETTRRPHYHAILFGIDFADKTQHSKNPRGETLYKSETLDKIWTHGHCLIGSVTTESCNYVARYIMKKVTGDKAENHYTMLNTVTGEIHKQLPEYISMSLKPGIGASWYAKYFKDVFPSDTVIANGKEQLPPKYYLKLLARQNPKAETKIKGKRIKRAKKHSADSTPERLRARLTCRQAKISNLTRTL